VSLVVLLSPLTELRLGVVRPRINVSSRASSCAAAKIRIITAAQATLIISSYHICYCIAYCFI
jgi:hypothetical protein